jgi:hypothetical protein
MKESARYAARVSATFSGTSRTLSSVPARRASAGLVIFSVLVDVPDVVELLPREDVPRRQHRRHHGVVLVVVAVHAVSAYKAQRRVAAIEIEPDGGYIVAVTLSV